MFVGMKEVKILVGSFKIYVLNNYYLFSDKEGDWGYEIIYNFCKICI